MRKLLQRPVGRRTILKQGVGLDEGMALATRLNLAALFIERTGNGFSERATPRFEEIAAKR